MSYLDPKERVIDLKITSYGRHLLSQGKFKPTFYAFFDDDIIYDGNYANINEVQSEIEPRIQENTPRMSAQPVFSAREVAVFDATPNILNDLIIGQDIGNLADLGKQQLLTNVRVQEGPEHTEVMQQPLGRSNSAYSNMPGWNARFLKAPLSSSSGYLQITSSQGVLNENIPQLNVNIQYGIVRNSPKYNKATLHPVADEPGSSVKEFELPEDVFTNFNLPKDEFSSQDPLTFDNGASIQIKKDSIILRLEESNTFFENENFEIEWFEIETVEGVEKLFPLKSYKSEELLIEDQINGIGEKGVIEEYFTFRIDEEIPSDIICPIIKEDKTKEIFHHPMFDCEESSGQYVTDIYTEVEDPKVKDLCP